MDAKVTAVMDSVDEKKRFKERVMQYDTNVSVVVRRLVKEWMKEHPHIGSSVNMIG
jgi:hypothetical protein